MGTVGFGSCANTMLGRNNIEVGIAQNIFLLGKSEKITFNL
jgi:hypothetical protein